MGQYRNRATDAVARWTGEARLANEQVVAIGRAAILLEEEAVKHGAERLPWARHRSRRDLLHLAV